MVNNILFNNTAALNLAIENYVNVKLSLKELI